MFGCGATKNHDSEWLNNHQMHSNNKNDGYFYILSRRYKKPADLSIWEAQLLKIMENDSLLRTYNFVLSDYVYDKKVKNMSELERIKSDIAKHNNISSGKNILKFEDEDYRIFLNQLLPTSEAQLSLVPEQSDRNTLRNPIYIFKENDLSKVILRWRHNGKLFSTVCLVSEKRGIVFDEILYFMASPKLNN